MRRCPRIRAIVSETERATRELLVELLGVFYAQGLGLGDRRRHLRPGRRRRAAARADRGPQGARPAGRLLHRATGRWQRRAIARRSGPAAERVQPDLLPRGPRARRPERRPLPRAVRRPGRRPGGGTRDHIAIRDLEMLKGIRGRRQPRRPPACPSSGTRPRERARRRRSRPPSRTRGSPARSRCSSPTTARTSGAMTSGRPSATPRSTTSCSKPRSPRRDRPQKEEHPMSHHETPATHAVRPVSTSRPGSTWSTSRRRSRPTS